jgi:hypothetical protein
MKQTGVGMRSFIGAKTTLNNFAFHYHVSRLVLMCPNSRLYGNATSASCDLPPTGNNDDDSSLFSLFYGSFWSLFIFISFCAALLENRNRNRDVQKKNQ